MKKWFLLLSLTVISSLGASNYLRGSVFHDINNNGQRDPGEPGIAGILVSNGYELVKTDTKGDFSLKPHARQYHIYISTPAGFKAGGGFYRKIDEATADYQFPLLENSPPNRFLQLTDIEAEKGLPWQDEIKAELKRQNYAFMIITGDVAKNRKDGLIYARQEYTEANYGLPIYFVLGNHDWCPAVTDARSGECDFQRELGPLWYSFDMGGVHFVVTPMLWDDEYTWAVKRAPGYTPEEIFSWVKKDLDTLPPDTPVILVNHANILTHPEVAKLIDFSKYNLTTHIYGHYHINATATSGKIRCFCLSSPFGGSDSPGSYAAYEFDSKGHCRRDIRHFLVRRQLCSSLDRKQLLTVNIYESVPKIKRIQVKAENQLLDMENLNSWTWQLRLPDGITAGEILVDGISSGKFPQGPLAEFVENSGSKNGYYTGMLQHQNIVYVSEADDANGKECGVRAYDGDTGQLLWRFQSENSIKGSMALSESTLLFCDTAETLYALEAANGREKWRKTLSSNPSGVYSKGVAAENGVVYAGHLGKVEAYAVADGKTVWSVEGGVSAAKYGGRTTVKDGFLVIQGAGGANARMRVYEAATGKLLWETARKNEYFKTTPLISNNRLFVGMSHHIYEFDLKTGEELKTYYVSHINRARTGFAVTEKRLVSGSPYHGVYGYYRDAPKGNWRFTPDKCLTLNVNYLSSPAPSVQSFFLQPDGDTIIFGGDDGGIYALNIMDGKKLWDIATGTPVTGLALGADSFYAVNLAGNLYKFKLDQKGKIIQ